MDSPNKRMLPASGSSPIRRRRFIVVLLALVCFIYFFGSPFRLPAALKDVSGISRANIVQLVKPKTKSAAKVDEIFGLIHLVTGDSEHEHILGHTDNFDPSKPVDMSLYAAGSTDEIDWNDRVRVLNERYPLVVFSKSYCPYSKRAKELLATYDLSPPPKVIEVDLRDDMSEVKHVLTRLTRHSTFPNVIIRGKSLGGSDQLQALHADKSLRRMLESAGMTVRGDIP
ncbi:thioredoxin-like protein [Mycena belliarum]|uniref:Thioredoxin-like protein n=1 Tax=Mycena belliarum TaxID=1033014 RepID=A0AAD6XW29_9AGAR|nr:thioredoxin-like protein [Mycena belliae]